MVLLKDEPLASQCANVGRERRILVVLLFPNPAAVDDQDEVAGPGRSAVQGCKARQRTEKDSPVHAKEISHKKAQKAQKKKNFLCLLCLFVAIPRLALELQFSAEQNLARVDDQVGGVGAE